MSRTRDPILSDGAANSLVLVTSQNITCPDPSPNQKNLKFGPRIPNPNTTAMASREGRLAAALVLGLGIIDSDLYLTQYSIIKELTWISG